MTTSAPTAIGATGTAPLGQSYAEHDKLGPLEVRAASVEDGGAIRDAMLAAFRDAAARARRAGEDVAHDPAAVVHDYRKALRRARAVLVLLAEALPKHERKTILQIVRGARAALSQSRDHAVAPRALSQLKLEPADQATADAILGAARDAAPAPQEVALLILDGAARVEVQAEALEAALPATIDWELIDDGLGDTYRAARKAHDRAKRSRKAFHSWRRRTKELTQQLDVLAAMAGPETRALYDGYAALSEDLGEIVDLIMLRDFIDTHAQAQPASAVAGLLDTLDDNLAVRMRASRKGARDLFERGGRKFVKKVARARRRDLEIAPTAATGGGATQPS